MKDRKSNLTDWRLALRDTCKLLGMLAILAGIAFPWLWLALIPLWAPWLFIADLQGRK